MGLAKPHSDVPLRQAPQFARDGFRMDFTFDFAEFRLIPLPEFQLIPLPELELIPLPEFLV